MARVAETANKDASTDYSNWEKGTKAGYDSTIAGYNNNVDGLLAKGNPYQSTEYLTNQNKLTSGAMNSQNTASAAAERGAALRTGTNTAAVSAQRSANSLSGQRQIDNYNASRDTQNQDKYLQWQQGLLQDKLAGANSQQNMFSTESGGRSNANTNLVNLNQQQNALWEAGIGAAGAGAAAAAKI